jgi:O-acetyl-ADP-ribose deacetylase (regulator of RNase III)
MWVENEAEKRRDMISFVGGNLLDAATEYIAQGVATGSQEGLGTGLALKISMKWPEAQQQFKKYTRNNSFAGGDIFAAAPTPERPGVIYIATQPDMYHATISYLNKGLRNLVKFCWKNQIKSVALPKIGAGLGKLDWVKEVKPLLMKHLTDAETRFIIYDDFKNEYESQESSGCGRGPCPLPKPGWSKSPPFVE